MNTSVLPCLHHSTNVPYLFLYRQHSVASVIGTIVAWLMDTLEEEEEEEDKKKREKEARN